MTDLDRHEPALPAALERVVAPVLDWTRRTAAGRLGERVVREVLGIQLVDRAMTIAAQAFTSVLPILIVMASLRPGDPAALGTEIVKQLGLPTDAAHVVEEAFSTPAGVSTTFGVAGIVVVLASATSFSRALIRLYCRIWDVPSPGLRSAWRWLAAVLAVALSVGLIRAARLATEGDPYSGVTVSVVTFAVQALVWVYVPWVLLAGQVRPRLLVPGGLLAGAAFVVTGYASGIYLPLVLATSAVRYGSLGVAFTYLSWLFVLAVVIVIISVVAHAVATDDSTLGRWVRGRQASDAEA